MTTRDSWAVMGSTRVTDVLVGGSQVLGTVLTAPVGRRRYNRWGALDAEVTDPMPGDELVPHPQLGYTRAVEIAVPPERVWPWLVQMGQGRGGLYSFDGLENLVGCDIHSADRVLPDHQEVHVGDLIRLGPVGYPCFRVAAVEPGASLVLVGADPKPPHAAATPDAPGGLATWQWQLRADSRRPPHEAAQPAAAGLPTHDRDARALAPGRAGRVRHGATDAPRHQAPRRERPMTALHDQLPAGDPVAGGRPRWRSRSPTSRGPSATPRCSTGVDLVVEPGGVFGLLGPNGAGKTTTVRILTGVLRPDRADRLRVLGHDLPAAIAQVRPHIGVQTDTALYDRLTGLDNLTYFGRLYGMPRPDAVRAARALLDRFGLADRQGDRVGTYSKGMKQKALIARALVSDPELVFLDEPTAGLDPEAAHELMAYIHDLSTEQGHTFFITSHRLEEMESVCTRVGVLAGGRIAAQGSPADVARMLVPEVRVRVTARARGGPRRRPRSRPSTGCGRSPRSTAARSSS